MLGRVTTSKIQEIATQQSQGTSHPGFDSSRYYTSNFCTRKSERSDAGYRDNLYFNYYYLPQCLLKSLSVYVKQSNYDGNISLGLYSIKNGLPFQLIKSQEIAVSQADDKVIKKSLFNINLEANWYAISYLASHTYTISAIHQYYSSNSGYIYGATPGANFETGLRFLCPYTNNPPENFIPQNRVTCNRSPLVYFELEQL